MGRRRPAGHLLLPGGARTQARVRRRDLRAVEQVRGPGAAAVGGVAVPGAHLRGRQPRRPETLHGWAIPTATDIAFALAVLAIIGSHLPSALRIFLLTLAVVDDLLAITIIAIFYTSELHPDAAPAGPAPAGTVHVLAQKYRRFFGLHALAAWVILLPLGAATWALVHASGIHATVAGVLLGFAVPVRRSQASGGPEAGPGLAEIFEHRFRPISAGFAVPVFAFFSAGVAVGGWQGLGAALTDPLPWASSWPSCSENRRDPRHHMAHHQGHAGPAGRVLQVDRRLRPRPSLPASVSPSRCWWPN